MVKYDSGGHGEPARLVASGSTLDLVTDIGALIVGVHNQLCKSDPSSARLFRAAVEKMISDPAIGLWDVQLQVAFGMAVTVPKKEGQT